MNTGKAVPFKWPFPPSEGKVPVRHRGNPQPRVSQVAARKAMLADVVMVIFWGASIPGFMWLGAICGF